MIKDVKQNSILFGYGVRRGDILTQINDSRIKTIENYNNAIKNLKVGNKIVIQIRKQDGSINMFSFELEKVE
jgi:S1-C subfamily serine protease